MDMVQDKTLDAMQRGGVQIPWRYAAVVAQHTAARLAQKQHVEDRAKSIIAGEFIRLQHSRLSVEEIVDMRLEIERMARIAHAMPICDRLLIARLVNDETKKEDGNAIRRVRKELRRC